MDTTDRKVVLAELAAMRSAEIIVARQAVPEPRELSCACLHRGISALRPEYRKALEVVELDGCSLAALAASAGFTAKNAAVRLHRPRRCNQASPPASSRSGE